MASHFDEAVREAAHRASRAVDRAMTKYGHGLVTDEDDLTGVLIGNLDTELEGQIGGLTWSTSILRHRKGQAAEEKRIGADMVIHVAFDTPKHRYSKGVLIQSKRVELGAPMSANDHRELVSQCGKMLKVTPASWVFDYARGSMRCGSASRIKGASNLIFSEECSWTPYRFFFELFRCPIGDERLTSALVRELPVPTVLEIKAEGGRG